MKFTKILILIGALAIVFGGSAFLYNYLSANNEPSTPTTSIEITVDADSAKEGIEVGNKAYDFTLSTYDGEEVSLSDFQGKIVILNFWASWCGPCQLEMPGFQAIQDKLTALGPAADAVFLTVNLADGSRETRDIAKAFLDKTGYTFPVVYDDNKGEIANLYQIYSIPSTYVIDKDGIIDKMFLGATSQSDLESAIEDARS